jgi:hypothetical protein
MLRPYSRSRPSRARCLADDWAGAGWILLEHHDIEVAAPPHAALAAVAGLRLRELPAVRALFWLRRLRHSGDATLRDFFTTAPFVRLAEEPGRELVSGVLYPRSDVGASGAPASAHAFRRALRAAPLAAIATFRAEPRGQGSLLWTETWVRTRGARARVAFGAYWLVIGPWSAWIRRMFLRAGRASAERAGGPRREVTSARPGTRSPGSR